MGEKIGVQYLGGLTIHFHFVLNEYFTCDLLLKTELLKLDFKNYLKVFQLGVVTNICNPSTWETEAGGSPV
jgi:hypothetical protein